MLGWLIALTIVVLLACLPLGISAWYNEDGAVVKIIAGPVRIRVFPREKKEKVINQSQKTKKGGSYKEFQPLMQYVLEFLRACHQRLRVKRLELKLIMAGGDPAALAINYGRAWAAVGNLMPQLERFFVIKKKDVEVEVDFTAQATSVYARVDITISFGRLLVLTIFHGSRALREYLNIINQRKGGAST